MPAAGDYAPVHEEPRLQWASGALGILQRVILLPGWMTVLTTEASALPRRYNDISRFSKLLWGADSLQVGVSRGWSRRRRLGQAGPWQRRPVPRRHGHSMFLQAERRPKPGTGPEGIVQFFLRFRNPLFIR